MSVCLLVHRIYSVYILISSVCLLELYAITVELFLEVDKAYKHYLIHIYNPNPADINLAELEMVTSVFKL